MLYGQTFHETIITSQVDGAAITAAAATSMLPAASKFVLPANFWAIGRKMRVRAWGRVSTVVTTPGTMRFDVRFGSTVIFDSLAIALSVADAYTNQPWFFEADLTCRAIGTSANLFGGARLDSNNIVGVTATPPKSSGVAMLPWNTAPAVGANFDSTATQIIDFFFTQTVATGSATCHQFEVILPN